MAEPTLRDRIGPGLDILSIGINPSLYSVEKGFNFARPGNRFWPAANASGLLVAPVEPGRAAMRILFERDRIGFTDIVKRPTRTANELEEAEYRHGAKVLLRKIKRHEPLIAWFQGTSACAKFLEFALEIRRKVIVGEQPERIGKTFIFVTPNPSGANPAANPKALLEHFRNLAEFRKAIRRAR